MFIVSMKTTRPRILSVSALVALLLVTVLSLSGQQRRMASVSVSVPDDAARQQVLTQLGYEVLSGNSEVREVLIPVEQDETFADYNAIQAQGGYDLSDYAGKRVKQWTYTVTNYPTEDTVLARLYVYKDKVIGGDISSTAQDGFCHGLKALTDVK